jgi:hypothetical protein
MHSTGHEDAGYNIDTGMNIAPNFYINNRYLSDIAFVFSKLKGKASIYKR